MLLLPMFALLAAEGDRPIVVEAERLMKGGDVMVCKSQARTNTRFGTRTCHTRAEWKQMAEESRRTAEEMIGAMRQNPCAGGDTYACGPGK